jgi:3D (Asp-Asp-Asp) domain-containing protein/FtsZ-binding cell division protein ZapB
MRRFPRLPSRADREPCYAARFVRAGSTGRRTRLAATGAFLTVALLLSSGARADDPAALRGEAERLQEANAGLATEAQRALLDLYSLESRLGRAELRLAGLRERQADVERRAEAARAQLEIARGDLQAAERQLAARLQTLYVEGEVDPLAVLLGAESLDEALDALDGLDRLATQDRSIVEQVRTARRVLQTSVRELAERRAQLRDLVSDAQATRDALVAARAERASYLASLHGRQAFNDARIADLLAQAAAAQERAAAIESSPVPAPAPAKGNRMTVTSTGYCLVGTTSTGVPTSWGVIAVDPSVIPLGTKMFVPGYGEGVAADTGSAVQGAMIDVWFPSCDQAVGWGQRVVTITLH